MEEFMNLNDEWLSAYEADVAAGKNLADSIFWRLALHCLPEGVDPADPRIQAALERIRADVERRQ